METVADSKPGAVVFDRRLVYRPFLERLNPIASPQRLLADGLIVAPDHDPRDMGEPSIHVAFANTAELTRGSQMALVGGIGSGKTTELLLTQKLLGRHSDAINIFMDLADYTDLSEISTGAILASAGLQLYSQLTTAGKELTKEATAAHTKLWELAYGRTEWVKPPKPWEHVEMLPNLTLPVEIPGLFRSRFPALGQKVREAKDLLLCIASPLLESDAQVTLLIDGLDRLITPELFRQFAEEDLDALKGTKISVIIVAPLLLWYDKSRFLQDYFDLVKHIPAAAADPQHSAFLRQILERRGALELMNRAEITTIAKYSGGVLRDLLTLARSSAEYAYRDAEDRIGRRHVSAAIKQLGNRYLVGLGNDQKGLLHRLTEDGEFPIENSTARELLVNRQVLEYFRGGFESFAVHPGLAKVLPKPA